ncbi:MAG TPA: ester cyclase [Edaphobacter sp.]|nr:ester cyclase [Edaphobacter sp.]
MTILEHWFEEVWNKRNVDAIDKLWVPEKIVHGLPATHGGNVETKAAFKTFHTNFCSAFPNLRIHVEDTVTERDKTVARVVVTGTHTGHGLRIAPTGKPVRFAGICMALVKDGHVVESWNSFDFLSMYDQLA